MGITANSGPLLSYGISQTSTGGVTEYNEQRGPSLFDCGTELLDPRPAYAYQPGAPVADRVYGICNVGVLDCVPGTVSSNCIAVTQVPTSGTYVTALTSSSTNNTVITAGVSLTAPENGATVTGLLGIDMGTATSSLVGLQVVSFGSAGTVCLWDPRNASARTIQWTGSSNSSNEVLSVAGRDVYGYKVTESIGIAAGSTTSGVATTKGQKAFKYISAITLVSCSGTIGSTNLIVGVNDTYGFPIHVDQSPYVQMYFGPSSAMLLMQLSTQFVAGLASSITAVATSADVRGTWTSSGASNSSQAAPERVFMTITPSAYNLPASATAGSANLFGNAQFSSI